MKTCYNQIKKILDKLCCTKDKFIFFDGHPVWTNKHQYKVFRQWFYRKKLECVICGVKADHFKFLICKGDGSLMDDGRRKYTFKLYDKSNNEFTLDHWIPKWLIIRLGIRIKYNLVPMCKPCNETKGSMLPAYFRGRETPKHWKKCFAEGH